MKTEQKNKKKVELLAPAGSLESFFAAMEKGADAVYAGLKDFSARAKAKNFTLQQMERMTAYAHGNGRKLYVTMNTVVKESELILLVNTLADLERIGIDGVIVQDMAIARLVREFFPGIPLHASTQMTVHNTDGVLQLAALGFERVVLARELHLDEISSIVAKSPIGIECFVHGALCFSISGQCFMSSFLGGHSGNRGRCAQPCRRQYKYRGKDGYYFSTNDFSSIDMIPQMLAAGVESLKIEGRMKSAEYVASIVGAYRRVIDAKESELTQALVEAKEMIKLSFGRVPTKGFLASHDPIDIAVPSLRGATGRFLGDIKSVKGDLITFESRDRLHIGDRVRVQPKSDMAGRGFTVRELFVAGKQVKVAPEKSRITLKSPFAASIGDAIFKVSSETAFNMSENACLKRLEGMKRSGFPCDIEIALDGSDMKIIGTVAGLKEEMSFHLGELEPSRNSDMTDVFAGQFSKCGETRFAFRSLVADGFPPRLIPSAKLKDIRREFYSRLEEKILPLINQERAGRKARALASIPQGGKPQGTRRAELVVRVEKGVDFNVVNRDGVDAIGLPISKVNMHQLQQISRKVRGREERIIWRLPFMIFDSEVKWYGEALKVLVDYGFTRFEAANISHFRMLGKVSAKSDTALEISTDYRLFSLNSLALLEWHGLGAAAATLCIEDDAENLSWLLGADLPILRRVVLHSEIPAITSKISIKSVKNDVPVMSDRGDGYKVTSKDGLTQITPSRRFSITQYRERLQSAGCCSFIVDATGLERGGQEQLLAAYGSAREFPDCSIFNFLQGLT